MKNYLYLLIGFILAVGSSYANSLPPATPKLIKFEISHYEVSNLDSGNIGKTRFQRNDCETGGYSLFNPFYEKTELLNAEVTSVRREKEVEINLMGKNLSENFILRNISIDEKNSIAQLDIVKGNVTFESKFYGDNLSEKFILDQFSAFQYNSLVAAEDCPPCVVVGILAIAAACETASQGCSPCNGTLVVGACSCSCTPNN